MEDVKAFFHRLNEAYRRNPNDSLLGEIIRRLMVLFDLTRAEACRVLVTLVQDDLYDYMAVTKAQQFAQLTDVGRCCWLRNLLLVNHKGLSKLQAATLRVFPDRDVNVDEVWQMAYKGREEVAQMTRNVRDAQRQRRQQAAADKKRAKPHAKAAEPTEPTATAAQQPRQNRPLSPHEWTDSATRQRCYEDPVEGVLVLPYDAPPRPTAAARWNPLRHGWYCDGQPVGACGQLEISTQ